MAIILCVEVLIIISLVTLDDHPDFALSLLLLLLLETAVEAVSVRALDSNGLEINTLGDAVLQHPVRASSFAFYAAELIISVVAASVAWRLVRTRPFPSSARPVS